VEFYTGIIYPVLLTVLAVVVLASVATLARPAAHRWLERAVTAAWVVSIIQALVVGGALVGGHRPSSLPTAIGYLVVSIAMLGLFGIGRLGAPNAGGKPDPERPVLSPRQIAQVDAVAGITVAIALAVVAWRLVDVMKVA